MISAATSLSTLRELNKPGMLNSRQEWDHRGFVVVPMRIEFLRSSVTPCLESVEYGRDRLLIGRDSSEHRHSWVNLADIPRLLQVRNSVLSGVPARRRCLRDNLEHLLLGI